MNKMQAALAVRDVLPQLFLVFVASYVSLIKKNISYALLSRKFKINSPFTLDIYLIQHI